MNRQIIRSQIVLSHYLHKFGHGAAGVAAIEFGLLVPVLVLMGIAVFDLGQAIYRDMQVQNAAQAGAQYAAAHGYDEASISAAVTTGTNFTAIIASPTPAQFCGCATSAGVDAIDCNSTCPDATNPGSYVTVSAQGSYATLLPYPLFPPSFTFTHQSMVRIQ